MRAISPRCRRSRARSALPLPLSKVGTVLFAEPINGWYTIRFEEEEMDLRMRWSWLQPCEGGASEQEAVAAETIPYQRGPSAAAASSMGKRSHHGAVGKRKVGKGTSHPKPKPHPNPDPDPTLTLTPTLTLALTLPSP